MTGRPRLAWIAADDPPDAFPDARHALREPNGLIAAGGDLSPERLVAAYRRGIFPWYSEGQPILWWNPDPRAVLFPAELRVSRRLARTLRSGRFEVSVDQAFDDVIRLCAETRAESGTWLGPDMIAAYRELHARGIAHSVESWRDGALAGGIYGLALGGVFFGESMVSLVPDGSKVAMARLAAIALERGIAVIDCQVSNPHLERLGSRPLPRAEFLALVRRQVDTPPASRLAPEPRRPSTGPAPGTRRAP